MTDINIETIKKAEKSGTLLELMKKVPSDQILAFVGLLVIAGVAINTINSIKEIVIKQLEITSNGRNS